MNYQQKKADPVGIGLLKEGDDAYFNSNSRPFGAGFYERSIICSYLYRRETAQKVTIFSKNSSKFQENNYPKTKSRAFWPDLQNYQQFSIQLMIFGFDGLTAE
jgi:hypothetical protein